MLENGSFALPDNLDWQTMKILWIGAISSLVFAGGCEPTGGPLSDGGSSDAGLTSDAGQVDGGSDAGIVSDAGQDAGVNDAGSNSGDCDATHLCPGGSTCTEVTPGGYRVCIGPAVEASACTTGAPDECCTSSDCAQGKCYSTPIAPVCAGVVMQSYNVCASDTCSSDVNCSGVNSICLPAGALNRKVRICAPGGCRLDADCTAHLGGICAPVADPCCHQPIGLFCVYPGTGCRATSDCLSGSHCTVSGNDGVCVQGSPACPL